MPVPLSTGRLNRRVTLQRATRHADLLGQMVETWTDVADLWAEVVPLSGNQLESARRQAADVSLRVTIRGRADVRATGWRLLLGVRVLTIAGVIDVEGAGRFLELACIEREEAVL